MPSSLRIGIPWRDLPNEYGPYTTAYNRYNRWSRRGIWRRIFEGASSKSRNKLHLMDSTMIKIHRAAAGAKGKAKQAISVSRGGRTSKIHALIDARGRPLRIIITGGQVHDSKVASDLIDYVRAPLSAPRCPRPAVRAPLSAPHSLSSPTKSMIAESSAKPSSTKPL